LRLDPAKKKYIATSRAIDRIPFLRTFLADPANIAQKNSVYVGWGRKRSGNRAVNNSTQRNSSFVLLEDGFLRSTSPGHAFPPLSIVVDYSGIYYDTTRPCDLENLLNSDSDLIGSKSAEVERAKELILSHELSKYNLNSVSPEIISDYKNPKILVIDQTYGDLSVELGGASVSTFDHMLASARKENPEAIIHVKTHPEVFSGRKRGYFTNLIQGEKLVLLTNPVNPVALLKQFDHIYTVSSTMGFEALLVGKKVSCFGRPWYSGWGITDDRTQSDRRYRERTILELFSAAYFHYARYLNPFTHEIGSIFDVIDWLNLQKREVHRIHGETSGRLICIGFQRWKRAHLKPILSSSSKTVIFCSNVSSAEKHCPNKIDQLVIWGNETPGDLTRLSEATGANIVRLEDGFIRSVGLGSDLIHPNSIVADTSGLYFDPHRPSDLETILNTTEFSETDLSSATELKAFIIRNRITKYNFAQHRTPDWASNNKKVILVPGQVEDDASIRFGTCTVSTNIDLLKSVRLENPAAYIVYKPHPDVVSLNRRGKIPLPIANFFADHVETKLSINNCIDAADEIHTMTSLCGFDALLRSKNVVTYGTPFYAGWGLTDDRELQIDVSARRTRKLRLEELIAGTLLYYPIYWDWTLKGYTDCISIVRQIVEERRILERAGKLDLLEAGFIRRQFRKVRALVEGLVSVQ